MSGKVLVAVVAVAVSSASAATVGVVYTKLVGAHNFEAMVSPSEAAAGPGSVKSAVVLNASGSEFFGDWSVDGDAPACSNARDSGRCDGAPGASDLQINILGKTLTIPPVWLGGNSEDEYTNNILWPGDDALHLFDFRFRARRVILGDAESQDENQGESRNGANNDSSASSEVNASQTDTQGPSGAATGLPMNPSLGDAGVDFPSFDALGVDPSITSPPDSGSRAPDVQNLGANWTMSVTPSNDPLGGAPEPSTWMLMAAGFAALGVFKRRRLIAYFKSARG